VQSERAHQRYRFTAQPSGPTIVRTEGVELVTSEGRRILDGAGGAVVNNIGHGRSEVVAAVAAAMAEVDYVLPVWTTPARLALADTLVERWLPDGFNHVFFAAGGSEANDTAIRLARAHHVARGDTSRYKIIGRLPSYHGSTLATLAAGGHRARRSGYEPLLAEWPKAPWDDADAVAALIESAGSETVAAFIAEPVIGAAGGALVASADYWARIAEVCGRYGVLTIADEVMTGFGRTGRRWGHEHDPWMPDILVSGKGLGGGYVPISLVSAADHVVDPITEAGRTVMFFTYSGHDSTCAGASAVLRILEDEGLVERAAVMGARLHDALKAALGAHPNVADVRGRGLMLGVELRGLSSADVVSAALTRDVWLYPAGSGAPVADAVLIAPPFVIDDRHIECIVTVLAESIDSVSRGR
jgi:adenosylmethionine-8-amino-7-oxononanoate aminotransferase